MNYSDIVKKKTDKIINDNNLLNTKYTLIRKINNVIEITYSKNYENIKKINNEIRNKEILNKLINNWNTFRDNDIEYYGDRSLYYNYKEEIDNIIKENNEINKNYYERINNLDLSDSEINSDNDEL